MQKYLTLRVVVLLCLLNGQAWSDLEPGYAIITSDTTINGDRICYESCSTDADCAAQNSEEAQSCVNLIDVGGVCLALKPGETPPEDRRLCDADDNTCSANQTCARKPASAQIDNFIAHKEERGFAVYLVDETLWGDGTTGDNLADSLRNWLQVNYLDLNLHYVLIIGDPRQTGDVPMRNTKPGMHAAQNWASQNDNVPTDYYFAELSGNWDLDGDGHLAEWAPFIANNPVESGDIGPGGVDRDAEVAVGRIPFYGTMEELDQILQKTMDYENEALDDTAWRNSALIAAEGANRMFFGEQIRDNILEPNGIESYRIYDAHLCTEYGGDIENCRNIDGDPDALTCSIPIVGNGITNFSPGLVVWLTHGGGTGAVNVMSSATAASLPNDRPFFTFQGSCSNSSPWQSNNISYRMLVNGAIGTIGATVISHGPGSEITLENDASNAGMAYAYAQRLMVEGMRAGDALTDLRRDIDVKDRWWYWRNYMNFNLWGDPSVGIYSNQSDVISFEPDPESDMGVADNGDTGIDAEMDAGVSDVDFELNESDSAFEEPDVGTAGDPGDGDVSDINGAVTPPSGPNCSPRQNPCEQTCAWLAECSISSGLCPGLTDDLYGQRLVYEKCLMMCQTERELIVKYCEHTTCDESIAAYAQLSPGFAELCETSGNEDGTSGANGNAGAGGGAGVAGTGGTAGAEPVHCAPVDCGDLSPIECSDGEPIEKCLRNEDDSACEWDQRCPIVTGGTSGNGGGAGFDDTDGVGGNQPLVCRIDSCDSQPTRIDCPDGEPIVKCLLNDDASACEWAQHCPHHETSTATQSETLTSTDSITHSESATSTEAETSLHASSGTETSIESGIETIADTNTKTVTATEMSTEVDTDFATDTETEFGGNASTATTIATQTSTSVVITTDTDATTATVTTGETTTSTESHAHSATATAIDTSTSVVITTDTDATTTTVTTGETTTSTESHAHSATATAIDTATSVHITTDTDATTATVTTGETTTSTESHAHSATATAIDTATSVDITTDTDATTATVTNSETTTTESHAHSVTATAIDIAISVDITTDTDATTATVTNSETTTSTESHAHSATATAIDTATSVDITSDTDATTTTVTTGETTTSTESHAHSATATAIDTAATVDITTDTDATTATVTTGETTTSAESHAHSATATAIDTATIVDITTDTDATTATVTTGETTTSTESHAHSATATAIDTATSVDITTDTDTTTATVTTGETTTSTESHAHSATATAINTATTVDITTDTDATTATVTNSETTTTESHAHSITATVIETTTDTNMESDTVNETNTTNIMGTDTQTASVSESTMDTVTMSATLTTTTTDTESETPITTSTETDINTDSAVDTTMVTTTVTETQTATDTVEENGTTTETDPDTDVMGTRTASLTDTATADDRGDSIDMSDGGSTPSGSPDAQVATPDGSMETLTNVDDTNTTMSTQEEAVGCDCQTSNPASAPTTWLWLATLTTLMTFRRRIHLRREPRFNQK